MGKDVLYAIRVLRKAPHFTLTAIAILALGIGAVSAMFSLVYAVLLRPLPYHDPDRIAVVLASTTQRAGSFPVPPADFLDFRAQARSFSSMAAAEMWSPSLTGEGEAEELPGLHASVSLFDVLGVHAAIGRTFQASDERPDAAKVAVIGPGLWKRRFGGDPAVIGRTVLLNREPYAIIGVLPANFAFPPFWAGRTEIVAPLPLPPAKAQDRRASTLRIFARLAPHASWPGAQAEIDAIARRLAAAYPATNAEKTAVAIPLPEISTGKVRTSLLVLLAAVGCLLLIACANLANLWLARASGRVREFSIRQALGASNSSLVRQLLVETGIVTAVGGALGLAVARWGVALLLAQLPGSGALPRQAEVSVGLPAALFNLGICFAATLAVGLFPALRAARTGPIAGLKESSRGSTADRSGLRTRSILVGAEVAAALILMAGAGLLIESFRKLHAIQPGFDARNVVAISTSVGGSSHAAPERRAAFYREAVDRLRTLPGVEAVSAVNHAPMVGDIWSFNVAVEGKPAPRPGSEPNAVYRVAMPGYLRAMGLQLVRGRDLDGGDRENTPAVALVNETMARRLWPGEGALGKRFRTGDTGWITVAGIVRDSRQWVWSDPVQNEMYLPFEQDSSYLHGRGGHLSMMLIVRTSPSPSTLAPAIRAQLRAIDPDIPVTAVQDMEQVMTDALWQQRSEMAVLSGFAALSLVLAAIGIYAVMSYVVGSRTQEIGIRMALGAAQSNVLGMVLLQSLRPVAAGLACGLAGAYALTRLMAGMLYEVRPADPGVLAASVLFLGVIAAAAAYIPAHRASRVDPLTALRTD